MFTDESWTLGKRMDFIKFRRVSWEKEVTRRYCEVIVWNFRPNYYWTIPRG